MMKLQVLSRTALCAAALGTMMLAPTAPVRADDIATTATKAGTFKTLLKAATAAGVAPALKGKTKLTVFAPTDAAFAKLPKGSVEMLLKPENKATLKKVLTYHVVAGEVPAKKVLAMKSPSMVKSLQGESLTVKHMGSKVMINSANVTKADVKADNGVIHVIDSVLLPPSVVKAMKSKM